MALIERHEIDSLTERQIATAAIVSTQFLRSLAQGYDPDSVRAPHIRLVLRWAMAYLKEFGKAPGRHIEDLFLSASRDGEIADDQEEMLADLLAGLSDRYEAEGGDLNAEYLLSKAAEHFDEVRLRALSEDIQASLAAGNRDEAQALVAQFRKIEPQAEPPVDPFTDMEAVRDAFEHAQKPIFKYPGALGELLNEHLVREGFVGFMGPEKVGKTWILIDLAVRANLAGLNVAFFELGDMSKRQIIRRKHIHLAQKSDTPKYCGRLWVPVLDCSHCQNGDCQLEDFRGTPGLSAYVEDDETGEERLARPWEAPEGYRPCCVCQRRQPHRIIRILISIEIVFLDGIMKNPDLRRRRGAPTLDDKPNYISADNTS